MHISLIVMQPRIENLNEKKLVGKRLVMSFANNKTRELWQSFMPQRNEILNKIGNDMYSMQIYAPAYFSNFNPHNEFEKWATVEVTDFNNIPTGMEHFTLAKGTYAVFIHKGSSNDNGTYQYIFHTWLPGSDYLLDHRPHFEIIGEKYKNGDPESEEEIWIPVKLKA